jgi:large subunit ribosomal protein L35
VPRNRSKPKKKLKTHKGAAKRFKLTAGGQALRGHSGKRHLMGTKKPKRMRHLKKMALVSPSDLEHVKRMLPYG